MWIGTDLMSHWNKNSYVFQLELSNGWNRKLREISIADKSLGFYNLQMLTEGRPVVPGESQIQGWVECQAV